ncbi:unnamed protein product [Lactuca virosa]|uniref:Uncharacterized protein n=1 Tax=Lactuca virosa TaxID=75947 RepID=A0AAU9MUA8_9ASTR|nr:unnamed protein product [Lactuca virosa]
MKPSSPFIEPQPFGCVPATIWVFGFEFIKKLASLGWTILRCVAKVYRAKKKKNMKRFREHCKNREEHELHLEMF